MIDLTAPAEPMFTHSQFTGIAGYTVVPPPSRNTKLRIALTSASVLRGPTDKRVAALLKILAEQGLKIVEE